MAGRCPPPAWVRTVSLPLDPYLMFADDFDPVAALASSACPRCNALGLVETDPGTVDATSLADRHRARYIMSPSLPARCPTCGLVMEWPACCDEEDRGLSKSAGREP